MVVSHAIAALEARHETKLFDRNGRRIALTQASRVSLMEARAILARAGAAELALSEFGTLKRGTLCVQASQTIAGYWLPRHLVAFQRADPRLWIQRPSSEHRRDFNRPIHAAQRTLRTSPPPQGARPVTLGFRPRLGASRIS
jgi:DNA-binding transcriptional LysR family regulator